MSTVCCARAGYVLLVVTAAARSSRLHFTETWECTRFKNITPLCMHTFIYLSISHMRRIHYTSLCVFPFWCAYPCEWHNCVIFWKISKSQIVCSTSIYCYEIVYADKMKIFTTYFQSFMQLEYIGCIWIYILAIFLHIILIYNTYTSRKVLVF